MGKIEHSHYFQADTVERYFSDISQENVTYTWLFLIKDTGHVKVKFIKVRGHWYLSVMTFVGCFNLILLALNPPNPTPLIPSWLQNEI